MVECVSGYIIATNQTEPGPASAITYTIQMETKDGVIDIAGCRPANNLPPDTLDVDATQAIGTMAIGFASAGRVRWFIHLWPEQIYCEGA